MKIVVTGYVGEGAKRMLADLRTDSQIELWDHAFGQKWVRFLYYRLADKTDRFTGKEGLKRCFEPFLRIASKAVQGVDAIVFFNSALRMEISYLAFQKLRHSYPNVKLILYIVDPIVGELADDPEYQAAIREMDLVYSINRRDCERYGFHYYPLIYSVSDEGDKDKETKHVPETKEGAVVDQKTGAGPGGGHKPVLYYLGTGSDRTEQLFEIARKCKTEGILPDFRILDPTRAGKKEEELPEGVTFLSAPISYGENVSALKAADCLLEIMHEGFDNPTQRYCEAVAYHKMLLTNNPQTTGFEYFNQNYMSVFKSGEEIDLSFVKNAATGENVDYGYDGGFSPIRWIERIKEDLQG